jgi:hypothetical protein
MYLSQWDEDPENDRNNYCQSAGKFLRDQSQDGEREKNDRGKQENDGKDRWSFVCPITSDSASQSAETKWIKIMDPGVVTCIFDQMKETSKKESYAE